MNSYNTIINELITQKQVLTEKGFPVNTANTYPSPSEITETIKNISFDLSDSTATEADVVAGKTFYSQTNELKTGTLTVSSSTELIDYIACLISGRGQTEIFIPDTVTEIRPYAFDLYNYGCDLTAFTHDNFTIPSSVQIIHEYAFLRCNLTGTLTIPPTVKEIENKAFQYTNISKCVIDTQLTASATDIFSMCYNLRTIEITNNVTTLYRKNLGSLRQVYEVIIPESITSIEDGTFYYSNTPNVVRFLNPTPIPISSGVLSDIPTTIIVVPAGSYEAYYNATNYLTGTGYMEMFASFKAGDVFPTTINDKTVVWYENELDCRYDRLRITECPADGIYFAVYRE